MPAEMVPFDAERLPAVVVADSSFVLEAFIDSRDDQSRHDVCRRFAERLQDAGTVLVLSPLLYLEAPQCWRRLYRRDALPTPSTSLDERDRRRDSFIEASRLLGEFLTQFTAFELALTSDLVTAANELAGTYNLRSHDAVHVAVARRAGVLDLVATDRDYRRVDGIRLWQP